MLENPALEQQRQSLHLDSLLYAAHRVTAVEMMLMRMRMPTSLLCKSLAQWLSGITEIMRMTKRRIMTDLDLITACLSLILCRS